jgi:apolipoprotein D and lipocalin family protein
MKQILLPIIFSLVTVAVSAAGTPDLETVPQVDLQRYLGRWYEIASLPQWFQRNCFGVTADYKLREDGDVDVLNRCSKGSLQGPLSEAHGKAWAVDASNAKLKVQFFWPFRGDYWIIELGADYDYAVVGSPNRKYLWILSRKPAMEERLFNELVEKIKTKHHYENLEALKKM